MSAAQRQLNAALLILGFLLMGWFMLSRAILNPVTFPLQYADEQGHYAYTQYLIEQHRWWPDLNAMTMQYERDGQRFAEPNYINHPPTFYWLMKLVQKAFPTQEPRYYRLVPLTFYAAGLAIYAWIGWRMQWQPLVTAAYTTVPFLLRLELQGGMYGNDAAAFLGGTLACYAGVQWLRGKPQRGAWCMAAALALASVKLNALLLVGVFCAVILVQTYRQNMRVPRAVFASLAVWCAVLLLPFAVLTLQYGSPAPNSLGQNFMLAHGDPSQCLASLPQENFLHFARQALQWLTDQTPSPEMTAPTALALLLCWLSLGLPRTRDTSYWIALAAGIAVGITLLVHLVFSYQRYRTHGWAIDMMARYYFPLMAAYGITVAATLARLCQWSRARKDRHAV